VTLTATHGTLTLSGTTGLTIDAGADGTNTLTVSGTITAINTALDGLTFTPTTNYNGSAQVQIVTNDQGNAGSGGPLSDTDSVAITVDAVNDPPVNTVPNSQSTNEDTLLVFSSGNGNQFSIADIDAGTSSVQVTLTAANGTVALSGTTGLTFSAGTGTGDATMTFTGTVTNVNTALNGLSFAPTANFNGAASLQILTNDQGNTGSGGPLNDTDTVSITVNAVNDVPVNTVPAPQSTNEDTALVFSSGNGNAISIADVDAGSNSVQVVLTATHGTVTLSGTTGLAIVGGADGTNTVTVRGTIAAINTALDGLRYAPDSNYNGVAQLQIVTNDLGNTGSGGALSDTDTVTITIGAVDDAPVNTVPGPQSTNEDTPLVFSSGNGNAISVADIDAGTNPVQVTLTATNGAVTLSGTTGLTIVGGADGTSTVTFSGTISAINAALDGLTFAPTTNYNGAASVQIVTNDQGNTGSGGPLSDTDTLVIMVGAVDDPPINTVPGAQSTNEDTPLVFASGNGNAINISDADAGSSAVQVTLTATNGTITLSGTTGLTIVGGADGTNTVAFSGTIAALNTALDGLTFTPTTNYNGAASVQIVTNDLGNTGSGGPLGDTDAVAITVGAVNDAPVNTVPGPQSTNEDTPLVFASANGNAISVADIDVDSSYMQVALTATNGTLTLSGTTGLTIVAGADGTNTVTFSGTISALNTALDGLTFTPTANFSGAAQLQIVTNDQGNTGSGGPLSVTDSVTITVGAVDDPPVNTVPSAQTTSEDTPLVFSGSNGNSISIVDIDAGSNPVQVTLTATNGTITLSGTTGLTIVGGADGTNTVAVRGTITAINSALDGLTFVPPANYNGTAQLQIVTNDLGNTGTGGPLSETDTVAITVGAVDDAPVNTVPSAQATNEDTPLVFSSGNGNQLIIADIDAGSNSVQVALTATNGTLNLSGTTGLTMITGADGTNTVTVSGTISAINAALDGLTFTPTSNYYGAASLQLVTNDLGNAGAGGPLSDTDSVVITVNAVNDPPVNTVPGPQSTNEDSPLVFSSGNGNAISVADIDAGSDSLQVALTATNGTITLAGTTGLTIDAGADGTNTVTFSGTITDINTALDGLTFTPTVAFNGAASLQIVTNDLGNAGSGGPLSDVDTVAINVGSVNDPPVNTVPGSQSMNEDVPLVFSSGNGNTITIDDIDAGSSAVQVTLTATNGSITLAGTTGLTMVSGADGTNTVTFSGTTTEINTALDGLTFIPTSNHNGAASLQIVTNDLGNSGLGGPLSDTDAVAITVGAVNDAPVNTVPGSQSTDEDTPLVFSSSNGNAVRISDIDAGASSVQVTLTTTNGTVTLASLTGLTIVSGADGTNTVTFFGTITAINTALDGLTYVPTANYNGAAQLQIVTNDLGNSGSGGPLSDTDTIAITVGAVNDAPINTVPGAQSTNEDTPLVFSSGNGNAIGIADVDAGSSAVQVTLTAINGTITLSGTTGLTIVAGADGTNTVTFSGAITAINTALDGLTFAPTTNYSGAAQLQIVTNDLGNTGSGGPLSDTATVAITVDAVDDAPDNTVPGPQSTSEDTSLVFSSSNGNTVSIGDADAGSSFVEATLTATHGLLTLAGTTGLSIVGGADGTSTVTVRGTITAINTAVDGLTFTPATNYNGAAQLQIVTNDLGNSGSGGPLSDTDSVAITIGSVDDPPVNAVPGPQSTNEDTALVFSSSNGNQISVDDLDAGLNQLQVTLTATHGTITLNGTAGLAFSVGSGTSNSTMTFTGTIADVNTALNGLSFAPTSNYNGAAQLQILTNDQGNTGAGGPLGDTDAVAITINAVNDAPVNTVPGSQSTSEDTPFVFSTSNGNDLMITDVDAAANVVQVALTATNGTLTLAGTAGLTIVAGADGTNSVTIDGTITAVNAALDGLTFTPTTDYNGAASLQIVTNDQGYSGSGGPLSDTDTVTITIGAVDDAPINSVPGPQSTSEDTPLVFSSGNGNPISVGDSDAGASPIQVALTAAHGLISLNGTAGLSFSTGSGTNDSAMTFTGTVAAVNTVLNGLSFAPTTNYNGAASLQIVTNDLGNTGSGGPLTDTDTISITVDAVDDPPINTVPAAQATNEGSTLVFSTGNGNAISIGDFDAGSNSVQVTLTATNGIVTLAGTAGLTIVGGADGTATASFTGTMIAINVALDGLSFTPTPTFNGAAQLQIVTNDLGNTGSGGPLSDADTVMITVGGVNDAPVNTVPGPQSTNEDVSLIFSTANGNAIRISDIDAGSSPVQVTLTATNGTATLSGMTGLAIVSGANGTSSVTFSGTITAINSALDGLTFAPTSNFNGAASLQIVTNDLGNTGSGGPMSDTDTVAISVSAVNDPPVNTLPGAQSTNEDTPLIFSASNGNAISIADLDAGAGPTEVTLTATNGTVTLSGTTGLTIVVGADGTNTVTVRGTIAAINTALDGLSFAPNANHNGTASLQLVTNDLGNTGTGGPLSDTDTVSITVGAVDDPPVNTLPGAQSTSEDTPLIFSASNGNAISIADVDAGSNSAQVTLTASNGTVALSGTAGLTIVGGANGTNSVTVSGTIAAINTALSGLTFTPMADYNGAASLQLITNDLGNTGIGGPLSDTDTVTIAVGAINDAPVNVVPGPQVTNEDVPLVFSSSNGNQISMGDVDAGSSSVQVTLTANNGTVTLAGTTALTIVSGADGTSTVTFNGTITAINTALDGLRFTPTMNYSGAAQLQIVTNDLANTGSGGPLSDTDTIHITVNAVDDPPVNTVPGAQTTNEDMPLVFSSGNGNLISIYDLDAGLSAVQVTLTATNGTVTLAGTMGLAIVGGADGTNFIAVSGTITAINTALDGLRFTPTTNYNGAASLQIVTNDQGNSGNGGPLSDTDTVAIAVGAVDDAPVNTVPGPQSMSEDTVLVFSNSNGNAVRIGDIDAGSSPVQVTLTATNGTATLAGTTGLTIVAGADGTNTVTFAGTITAINTALDGLTFTPTANYNGAASLQIVTNDLANTGSGGPLSDTDSVAITVSAVNDPPVNTIPGVQSTNEETPLTFSVGNGNAISITDTDAGSNSVQVTLTATNGRVTLAGTTGLTMVGGADGTNTVTFNGTITAINTALNGLNFVPTTNYNGAASLQITTNDLGNTGSGGPLNDTDSVSITVNTVDDAPVNTVPGPQATNEDTPLVFSSGNGNRISIADVDAGSTSVQMTLTATNGTVTLPVTTGLTIVAGVNGTSTVTVSGTTSSINTALDGLTFTPTANFNGAAQLQIVTNDQGNTGTGGPLSDTDTISIAVNAVNDSPVNTVPGPQSTNEDTQLVFSSGNGNRISIADIDAGSSPVQVTLTATNGKITLVGTSGLAFSMGSGTNDSTMTFTGTVANINAALNNLNFAPTANYSGAASLQIASNDQGNTGSGGSLSDTDTFSITVNAVNDSPVNTVPGPQSTNEDTPLVFAASNGNPIHVGDVDAASNSVHVTLTSTNGALTLSGTAGLAIIAGAESTNTVTVSGTITAINAALDGLTFRPTSNYNGAASLQIITNDQGNSGLGGPLSDTDIIAITVNAVNNAPVNTVPGPQVMNEDTPLEFSSLNGNQIRIADVDAGNGSERITLTAVNGSLTLNGTAGLTFTAGTGSNDGTMIFTGTITAINAALNGLTFTPTANYNGAASVQIVTNDLGNTGAGGSLTDTDTIAITVGAVDDAPINTVPGPQSTNEDTPLMFSSGSGNQLSIGDIDAGANSVQVSLTAINGTIRLNGVAGLTFSGGTGTGDTTMTFAGAIANINAALNGLSFTPTVNFSGAASLQIVTNDLGNNGNGGPLSDTSTIGITVNAVNDAPVNTIPGAQSTNEGTPLVFSSGNGNAVSIADIDAGSSSVQATLTTTNGAITLSGTNGLTIVGGADGTNTITIRGPIAAINTALDGLIFTPTADYHGAASLQIATNDLGNTGLGGAKVAVSHTDIQIRAVGQSLALIGLSSRAANYYQVQFSSALGTGLSIVDANPTGSTFTVILTASNGFITLAETSGVTVLSGGTSGPELSFQGTLSAVNGALNGIQITTSNSNASLAVTVISSSQSSNGLQTVHAIIPINQAPSLAPLPQTDVIATTFVDGTIGPATTDDAVPSSDLRSHSSTNNYSLPASRAPDPRNDTVVYHAVVETEIKIGERFFGILEQSAGDPETSAVHENTTIPDSGRKEIPKATLGKVRSEMRPYEDLQKQPQFTVVENSADKSVTQDIVTHTGTITVTLSMGYVLWSIRTVSLMTGMYSSIPTWQTVDPLSVLEFEDRKRNGGEWMTNA
jgi:hypothetical protein